MRIGVECYAGYRGEETPRRIVFGARSVSVEAVLDRWLAPEHRYFKIRGGDGATYILRQDVPGEAWELVHFAAGDRAGMAAGSPRGDRSH